VAFRRPVVRVFLVDHAYRVLLLHVADPPRPGSWWQLPGGTPRRRESAPDACLRLLREETGIDRGVRAGPCVWERARERTYVAWLDEPGAPRADAVPAAVGTRLGERWWTLDELTATTERLEPPRLPALAPAIVRGEYGLLPD
jgi:ADP-ribose pyrophosphatase YjhB (NUDIX family)